jgi:hypothetical protein
MAELSEMLKEATEGGGFPGLGGGGDFPGFRGGPASLPPATGGPTPGSIPAAFGGKKKRKK